MSEILSTVAPFITALEPGVLGMLLMAAVVLIVVWHVCSKIIPQWLDKHSAHSDKILEMEEMRMKMDERRARGQEAQNALIQRTLNDQHGLLTQNTEVVKGLARTLESMNDAFRSVSERVAVSDAITMKTHEMLAGIQEKMPDKQLVDKIHDRIDTFGETFPTRQDVQDIKDSIEGLNSEMNRANSLLTEIRTRQLMR